jgi:glycosyltransferase involved in cell wall biosynthesis
MRHTPRVTVCVPVYNGGRFLAATIESVLKQTCGDWELVISDNRSTDNTVAVAQQYADARIRLLESERHLCLADSWNRTLLQARGAYIKVLCADDLLYPGCLAEQIQALDHPRNSGVALTFCDRDVIGSQDEVLLRRRNPFVPGFIPGRALVRQCARLGTNLIGEPMVGLFRKAELRLAGKFEADNPYLIDLAFWASLLKHGDAYFIAKPLAAFRVSPASVSTRLGLRQARYYCRFVRKMRDDAYYRLSRMDLLMGIAMSCHMAVIRTLFTAYANSRTGRTPPRGREPERCTG